MFGVKIHCRKHFNLNERPVMCDQHKHFHVINAMDFFFFTERCSNFFSIALVKKKLKKKNQTKMVNQLDSCFWSLAQRCCCYIKLKLVALTDYFAD